MIPAAAYITSGPHLSGYRVTLGYETLADAQDAHEALSKASRQAAVSSAEQVVTEPAGRSAPNLDAGVVGDLVEALRQALKYAAHDGDCSSAPDARACACGYRDAATQAEAALAKYATQGAGGKDRRPFAEVFSEAYGWTLDNEGYLAGLVAGDMGYDFTDMKLTDLLVNAQVAENKRLHAAGVFPCPWPFHEALMAFVKSAYEATHQPAISTDRSGPFSPEEAKIPGGDASNGAADHEGAGE